jgi:hypothetical protein
MVYDHPRLAKMAKQGGIKRQLVLGAEKLSNNQPAYLENAVIDGYCDGEEIVGGFGAIGDGL